MKSLYLIFLTIFSLLGLTTYAGDAGEINALNQGVVCLDTAHMVQRLRTDNPGQRRMHRIVQQGGLYNQDHTLETSREAAHQVLAHRARHHEQDKKVKGYARIGLAQLLARHGSYPSSKSVEEFHHTTCGRLQNIWDRRAGTWATAALSTAGIARPRGFMGYVGTWLAILKSDLFQRGFLNAERRDLPGAWALLDVVGTTYSSSKTIPLFRAGVLLEGITHGFNPFDTAAEREQELARLLGDFETVSHRGGTHARHGAQPPAYHFGHVRPKPKHVDGDIRARLRAHIAAAAIAEGEESDGEDGPDDGFGGAGAPGNGMGELAPEPGEFDRGADGFDPPSGDFGRSDEGLDPPSDDDAQPFMMHMSATHAPDPREAEAIAAPAIDTRPSVTPPPAYFAPTPERLKRTAPSDEEEDFNPYRHKRPKRQRKRVIESDEEEEKDDCLPTAHSSMAPASAPSKRKILSRTDLARRDAEIKRLQKTGLSQLQITKALQKEFPGTTKSVVARRYLRLGLSKPANNTSRLTADQKERVIAMVEAADGAPDHQAIMAEVGCSKRQVERTINTHKVATGTSTKKRTQEEVATLRAAIIRDYKAQQEAGMVDIRALAANHGVSAPYISSKVITPAVKRGELRATESRLTPEKTALLEAEIRKKDGRPHAQVAVDFNAAHFGGENVVKIWRVKEMRTQLFGKRQKKASAAQVRQLKALIIAHPEWGPATVEKEYQDLYPGQHVFTQNGIGAHKKALKEQGKIPS